MKILVLNGPCLNMLGVRQPEIYGNKTYKDLKKEIIDYSVKRGIETEIYQSNHEGDLVDKICSAAGNFDGIIINPAAYTHTSAALLDALLSVNIPAVEVHLTDPEKREDFRKISFVRSACISTVKGKGFGGYLEAIDLLVVHLK